MAYEMHCVYPQKNTRGIGVVWVSASYLVLGDVVSHSSCFSNVIK